MSHIMPTLVDLPCGDVYIITNDSDEESPKPTFREIKELPEYKPETTLPSININDVYGDEDTILEKFQDEECDIIDVPLIQSLNQYGIQYISNMVKFPPFWTNLQKSSFLGELDCVKFENLGYGLKPYKFISLYEADENGLMKVEIPFTYFKQSTLVNLFKTSIGIDFEKVRFTDYLTTLHNYGHKFKGDIAYAYLPVDSKDIN